MFFPIFGAFFFFCCINFSFFLNKFHLCSKFYVSNKTCPPTFAVSRQNSDLGSGTEPHNAVALVEIWIIMFLVGFLDFFLNLFRFLSFLFIWISSWNVLDSFLSSEFWSQFWWHCAKQCSQDDALLGQDDDALGHHFWIQNSEHWATRLRWSWSWFLYFFLIFGISSFFLWHWVTQCRRLGRDHHGLGQNDDKQDEQDNECVHKLSFPTFNC